jgi:tetratricopeptide (TPR) repeat protein
MSEHVDTLLTQAAQARHERRPADARRDLMQVVEICRQIQDRRRLAKSLKALGQIERDMHRADEALDHYREAAAIYRATLQPLHLAHTIRHIADILQDQGHLALAEPCYQEALAIYRAHRESLPLDLANTIRGLALLKGAMGETDEAGLLWAQARDLYSHVNVEAAVAEISRRLEIGKNH